MVTISKGKKKTEKHGSFIPQREKYEFPARKSVEESIKKEVKRKVEPVAKEEVKKTFTPGKYIASRTGAKFHAPKCDWAKRIKAGKRVWLKDKAEAKKKGYKQHSCLKK